MSGIGGIGSNLGIDTGAIIESIMGIKTQRVEAIEDRISGAEEEKRSFLDINARLLTLQEVARRLYDGTSFNSSVIQSTNPAALLATGDTSSFEGTFQFITHSMASVSQYVSNGFFDTNVAKVTPTAGTFSVEVGAARVIRPTDLDQLNGGTGIDRGEIRITDDSGRSATVDLTNIVTINDVLDAINGNGVAQVKARINDLAGTGFLGDGLIIENTSGAGNIKVENVGFGATATSLGIEATSATGSIVGLRINTVGSNTSLASLNDSRGISDGRNSSMQITITGSGAAFNVDLAQAKTLGDVIDTINAAAGTVSASVAADGKGLLLSDAGLPATITIVGTSALVDSLGLNAGTLQNLGGGDFAGRRVVASLNSVDMNSLAGTAGNGFSGTLAAPSTFDIVDSLGAITTVTFTGREDLYEIIDQINNPIGPSANVTAKVDASGRGVEIIDDAGGAGSLTITDTIGTVAAEMGIAGVHADGIAEAGNLNFKHFNGNRLLSDFGFDFGYVSGSVEVTLSDGSQSSIDLNNIQTLGQFIDAMNAMPTLTVDVNSTGDGLVFNDTTGGTGPLVFRDSAGSFARRLNFFGTFTGGPIIDRAFEFVINVDTDDTLNDIVDKMRGLDIPVTATILNDGSSINPFRLSITGSEPGAINDVVVSSTVQSLSFSQTSAASDAIMLFGSSVGTADPVVVRSENNTFKKVLSGVTLDMLSISEDPIIVSITRDLQASANDINELIDAYNSMADRLDEVAGFNVETLEGGPLLGDNTLTGLEYSVIGALIDPVDGLPLGANIIASFGIDIGSDGRLEVDSEVLLKALEDRLQEVEDIFSNTARLSPDTLFKNWNSGDGIKHSSAGADLRISFRDGSADLTVDVSSYDRLGQFLDVLNADARLQADISPDSRRIIIRDLTAGAIDFSIVDENDSGTVSTLGLTRTIALPNDDKLETKKIMLDTELGVARRVDNVVKAYTETDGLIDDATETIDDRITRFNEDIKRLNERLDTERERLERQFAAMEVSLGQYQQTSQMLTQALDSMKGEKK